MTKNSFKTRMFKGGKMRRLFTIILSLSCVFTLMACGAKADDEETTKTAVSVESAGKTGTVNEDVPISGWLGYL